MDGLDTLLGEAIPSAALTLARRFAAGATMWCVSPPWPEHARHLAVEFVHPVIVGTRALPAVSAHDSEPVAPPSRSGRATSSPPQPGRARTSDLLRACDLGRHHALVGDRDGAPSRPT
jgi:hypothetical protein